MEIVSSVVLTSPETNVLDPNVALRLLSSYFTVIVSPSMGIEVKSTLSPSCNPWVEPVETVTIFLPISPLMTVLFVLKL